MRSVYNTLFMVAVLLSSFTLNAQRSDLQLAQQHLQQSVQNSKFAPTDLQNPIVTDHYTSQGITHIYFRQSLNDIEIYGANAAVHIANGQVLTSNNQFIPGLQKRKVQSIASLTAAEVVEKISQQKAYPLNLDALQVLEEDKRSASKRTVLSTAGISHTEIKARLVYVLEESGDLKLAWDVAIDEIAGIDYMNYRADASTGKILQEESWTIHCNFGDGHGHVHDENCSHHNRFTKETYENILAANSYTVFPVPVESPNHGSRSDVLEPWLDNTTASPDGWHTIPGQTPFTSTHGNNVDAYDDSNNTNSPTGGDAARADGGANLDFDFPLDVNGNPADYKNAAITNLFYWGNITHDVWYNYGFDEPSGNFQENNYGRGGNGGDSVNMEAQDGSGTCNANMSTPSDGGNARCQMYLCNGRDGDFDNGVIVHEYGHGISIRLTGGPNTSGCLNNQEQMGEGWSDYFGTVMTIEAGDQGTDARPMGTWLFGQGPNGGGIRPYPYSTDMGINPMTYATVASGVSVPHGVGSVWATMLWDLTWALIDEYGWNADLYAGPSGTGGNNIAMALVTEGLKLQPCSPGFVDGRDAILAADVALYGGANQCLIWEAFARRGLGYSASQGSSGSVSDGTEAFDLPPSCSIGLEKTANVSQISPGGNITYTLTATNNTGATLNNVVISDDIPANTNFVSANNGGSLSGSTVTFPAVSLADGATHTVSFTVQVDAGLDASISDFSDDMESGSSNWSTSNTGNSSWNLQTNQSNSGSTAWFAQDVSTTSIANLDLASAVGLTNTSTLTFSHFYNTETSWDGGVVEISTDGGTSWQDLGNNMTQNGYNSTINNSRPAFSGNSGGFITTIVDLSSFAGNNAIIRFQNNCDVTIGGTGWYVDDVSIDNLALYIPNTASVTDGNITSTGSLANPTEVIANQDPPLVVTISNASDVSCNGGSDGSATANASGGNGTYTYAWSSGETTQTASGLGAGSQTVTVTSGSQSVSASVTIGEPAAISISFSTTDDNGTGNGSATANVSGGTIPYSYSWSNNQTGQTATNLTAGTYSVEVTDANNCTSTASVTINDSTPSVTVTMVVVQNVSCNGGSDGSATAVANGGTGTYSYLWSNGQTTTTATGLSAGTHSVTVTSGSQSGTGSITITEPSAISVATSSTDDNGTGNGTATANASGGTPSYSYLWSDGQTTQTATGLAAGTYTVIVTDANNCSTTASVAVGDGTPQLNVSITLNQNVSCNGGSDGSATANASGGIGGYTYLWSNGATTATVNNLPAGTHSVTVSSGTQTVSASISVSEPSALNLSLSSTPDTGSDNGTATAAVSGGTSGYSYQWSNGQTTATAVNLDAGTYTVVVTDANGCQTSGAITVDDQTPPPGCEDNNLTLTFNFDQWPEDISYVVRTDGGTVVSSGGPYGNEPDGSTLTIDLCLADGCYEIEILDAYGDGLCASYANPQGSYSLVNNDTGATIASGCDFGSGETTSFCLGVTPPDPLVVTASSMDVSCNGDTDGSASATASGGDGTYTYAWSNGGSTGTISGLGAGTYTVTVTSGAQTATATATVNQPTALNISTSSTPDNGSSNGTATATVSGGTAPYSYAWSDGQTTATASGLAAGTYSVDVTDSNGCVATGTVTVEDNTPPPGCQLNAVILTIILDNYPEETSWDVKDENGLVVASSNGTYAGVPDGATITEEICLPDGCFDFTIYDAWGDGICCAYGIGSYELFFDGNVLASGGDFGASETTNFCLNVAPPPGCTEVLVDFNNFEGGWGIWNDGGSDARRSANDANYALGTYCVRLRDNTNSSVMTTDVLDLSTYEEITVDFSYYPRSMDNSNEDFWLQISTDGGASYTTVEEWNRNDEFQNNIRYYDAVTVPGPFTANTRIRFRCDASGNSDWVYIDEVEITGCTTSGGGSLIADKNDKEEEDTTVDTNEDIQNDTSIESDFDIEITDMKVFPNPVSTQLTITYQVPVNETAQLLITDFTGRVMMQNEIATGKGTTQIEVGQYTSGYYMAHIIYGKERMSQKFVVVK